MLHKIRTNTHQESIITQLVFNHALRMRLDTHKSGTAATDKPTDSQDGQDASATKSTSKDDENAHQAGKINNLITSDLALMMDAPFVLTIRPYFFLLYPSSSVADTVCF